VWKDTVLVPPPNLAEPNRQINLYTQYTRRSLSVETNKSIRLKRGCDFSQLRRLPTF
jgi:hypothetical protein